MITYEEALKLAKTKKPNTNNCTEYEDAYMFGSSEDEGYDGGSGHTACVILKETGVIVTMSEYILGGDKVRIIRDKFSIE